MTLKDFKTLEQSVRELDEIKNYKAKASRPSAAVQTEVQPEEPYAVPNDYVDPLQFAVLTPRMEKNVNLQPPLTMSASRRNQITFDKPIFDLVASPYVEKTFGHENDYGVQSVAKQAPHSRNVELPALVKSHSV